MIDWIQVAGFTITLVLFIGVVFGGWAYYNSEQRKVHTSESDKLAITRGKRIEDLEDHIARLEKSVQNQQGQIDMLRAMKTEEIIEGVVKGLKE